MTNGQTAFLTIATVIAYGTSFGVPLLIILGDIRKRMRSGK